MFGPSPNNSTVQRTIVASDELQSLADEELLRRSRELRWRVRAGEPLSRALVECGALVREASRRSKGMAQYPVQLLGGFEMLRGRIVEMQTGEGKTLTAVLPAYARALAGKGCHVLTVNDYLAERDAGIMRPVYEALGLTVGCIVAEKTPEQRREAYACDVTYGTAKEMGFDFLRDRLNQGAEGTDSTPDDVQRGHHFALIDEADSILVDEARTPLLIGTQIPNDPENVALFRWCHRISSRLQPLADFTYDPRKRQARLTDQGCRTLLLSGKPSLISGVDVDRIYEQTEKALVAFHGFQKDRDYVVVDDEIVIVDESTGRVMEGRKWQDGLHQAVEAKEGVPITAATGSAAQITMQSFFRRYTHLAGMTGTGMPAVGEFRRAYDLPVSVIPTHRPCLRETFPTRVFATQQAKGAAVVEELRTMIEAGRSVLVGTPSVEASEKLSETLTAAGIDHQVLNARNHEAEAAIVAEAGQPGRVTVATNMAGRGTDIELDDAVREAGGLHVVATEMHSSKRIDRQLFGRAARQGDPGSYRVYLSLEDELLRVLPPEKRTTLARQARPTADGCIAANWEALFQKTQRQLEKMHRKQRKGLLKAEKERAKNHRRMGLDPYLELVES